MNKLWWWEEDRIEEIGESLVQDMFINGLGGEGKIDGEDRGE